jgi:hypothetical protein
MQATQRDVKRRESGSHNESGCGGRRRDPAAELWQRYFSTRAGTVEALAAAARPAISDFCSGATFTRASGRGLQPLSEPTLVVFHQSLTVFRATPSSMATLACVFFFGSSARRLRGELGNLPTPDCQRGSLEDRTAVDNAL